MRGRSVAWNWMQLRIGNARLSTGGGGGGVHLSRLPPKRDGVASTGPRTSRNKECCFMRVFSPCRGTWFHPHAIKSQQMVSSNDSGSWNNNNNEKAFEWICCSIMLVLVSRADGLSFTLFAHPTHPHRGDLYGCRVRGFQKCWPHFRNFRNSKRFSWNLSNVKQCQSLL